MSRSYRHGHGVLLEMEITDGRRASLKQKGQVEYVKLVFRKVKGPMAFVVG